MNKLEQLMRNLPENMDAAIVTSDTNRRYYTGFQSSSGFLVITREISYLIVDARYHEAAQQTARDCQVVLQDNIFNQFKELLKKQGVKNVGVESDTMPLTIFQQYEKNLTEFNLISDRSLSEVITNQRAIKSEKEKEYMQLSQDITDKTLGYILERIAVGRTETEIALDMEVFSRTNGSEEAAFSFIVATGNSTSRPHAVPKDKKVEKGDFVLMDFGSTYMGYRSDMTRTVAVGEPSNKQREVYELVLQAQLAALDYIKPGVPCDEVHKLAMNIIDATPYKGLFNHGLGHSIGLDVHEPPNFNLATTQKLEQGVLISVEPGVYLPGEFGVRIEDLVYITKDGLYNFTHSPKELIVL